MHGEPWTLSVHSSCLPPSRACFCLLQFLLYAAIRFMSMPRGAPQASYAEDDSPQLSEDDNADGAAAEEDDGEEYMARAALGLRTKPRKVLPQLLDLGRLSSLSGMEVPAGVKQDVTWISI